ncbi:MAG TPA: putative peptide modification system cyclase [Xanthomonadaceae bacterium]|nr:putative peptide modification system cyclase [Xanthomonadaceae bacterium]
MADQTRASVAGPSGRSTQLRTVMLCDLVDSTALIERLGDRRGSDCIRGHDHAVRELLDRHGGREIDKTDGFLALFERPIQAVAFALDYQRRLRTLSEDCGQALSARVGIHVGEVVTWDNEAAAVAAGAKRTEVEGLAKPVAARLMTLARPGQILLSGVAQNLAQRAQDELPPERAGAVRWLTHGRYRFKGVAVPMRVHEVGEAGQAPLLAPPSTPKAQRERPWWRSPVALGLEAATALFAVAAVLFILTRPQPAIAFAERDWVVIGDLNNLTSEPLFDDALETAFRIGLEQSRYVNVVPSLQVRDALRRMERDPTAALDRDTAVEIALREGARAVIMPTIAEVGGRVRVTAEVVDPNTQVTVYGESADGKGAEAALPALDDVITQLRERLGESLASIEQSSAPLEKVATGDLEALRAFSLGIGAAEHGRPGDAYALFERAIELDPGFAAAHAKMAGYYYQSGNREKAYQHIREAAAVRERLTARDQLYVDGYLAFFEDPAAMRNRWMQLAQLYPDMLTGQQNVGIVLWLHENAYAEAEPWFAQVADSRHPLRGVAMEAQAAMLLAMGRTDQALARLDQAAKLRAPRVFRTDVVPALVARDYAAAESALDQPVDERFMTGLIAQRLRQAMLHADRGQVDAARDVLEALRAPVVRAELPETLMQIAIADTALRAWNGRDGITEALRRFVVAETEALQQAPEHLDDARQTRLLLAAVVAAWAEEADLAAGILDATGDRAAQTGFPVHEALANLARAELALHRGEPDRALAQLAGRLHGRELYLERYLALRAAIAAEDIAAVEEHVDWLVRHRARAMVEYATLMGTWVPNVVAANDAVLGAAEFFSAHGRAERARLLLMPLLDSWPESDSAPARRLAALRNGLLDEENHQSDAVR